MKKLSGLVALFVSGAIITGCSGTAATKKKPPTGITRSVYIYMCGGDTEKEDGCSSAVLDALTKPDYPENINVVVETGGSESWKSKDVDSDKINRFEATKGKLKKIQTLDDADMSRGLTLSEFIVWAAKTYPSDHKTLIIQGQGGEAYRGAYDARHDHNSLDIDNIAWALGKSGQNFDMIGFDNSTMSSLECAAAVAPYSGYMTASEETESSNGWDYESFINAMINNPTLATDDIGKNICDSYMSRNSSCNSFAAMSVINLSKISTLTQTFDGICGKARSVFVNFPAYSGYANEVKKLLHVGGECENEGISEMADMASLADVFAANGVDITQFKTALNDAVIYKTAGEYRKNYCGLNICYPDKYNEDKITAYRKISPCTAYSDFLSVLAGSDRGDTKAYKQFTADNDKLQKLAVIADNTYQLNFAGNMNCIDSVRLALYKKGDNSKYMYLGDEAKINENREAGIYKDAFDGNTTALMMNGETICAELIEKTETFSVYSVPMYIDNVKYNMRAVYITDGSSRPYYKICSFTRSSDKNYKYRSCSDQIKTMSNIEPVFRIYNTNEEERGKSFRASPFGVKIEENRLKDGDYKLEFRSEDVYGETAVYDPSDVTLANGTATKK